MIRVNTKNEAKQGSGFQVTWQRLDPRVKLLTVLALTITIVATPIDHHLNFALYTALLLGLAVLSRVPVKRLLLRFLLLLPLLVFLAASLLLVPGKEFTQKIPVLYDMGVKTVLVFLGSNILGLTVEFHHIIKALELMKFPRVVTQVMAFGYRYLFLFRKEATRVMIARESRSSGSRVKWREIKAMPVIIPFFIFKVLERSERIYAAMLSRGYRDSFKTIGRFSMTWGDYFFLTGFFLCLAAAATV